MNADPRFLEGLSLFNKGEYFECHEVIEDLWLETPEKDPFRNLYKGVIQAAAAIYQFDRGILTGALGLYKTSVSYLSSYEPKALGLDVTKLVNEMNACFLEFEEWDGRDGLARNLDRTPKLVFEKE